MTGPDGSRPRTKRGAGGRPGRRTLLAALLAALGLWLATALLAPAFSTGVTAPEQPAAPDSEAAAEPAALAEPPQAPNEQQQPQQQFTLPVCRYASEPAPLAALDQWPFTLLDTTYRLTDDYVPPNLVDLPAALSHVAPGQHLAGDGHRLRAVAAAGLVALFEAAEAAGVRLAVQSAYRSHAYQASTFDYWTQLQGHEQALLVSARAGHSEHQLGTAVDLRSRHGPAAWDVDDWAATPEGAWTKDNAHHYGFVMSYPEGEERLSCYAYEPWHFRYVGREVATAIAAAGVPPRVYLWQNALNSGAVTPVAKEGE